MLDVDEACDGTVPYQTKYEWSYLYSALEVDGENAAHFLCLPSVSLPMSRLFLEDLARRDPQAEHVVIWDQAGFHLRPDIHPLPPQVHIIPLPPYSPELNPVEIIGDLIKDRIGNTLWESLDKLEEAIVKVLRPIYESAAEMRTLVSHDRLVWINTIAARNNFNYILKAWYNTARAKTQAGTKLDLGRLRTQSRVQRCDTRTNPRIKQE